MIKGPGKRQAQNAVPEGGDMVQNALRVPPRSVFAGILLWSREESKRKQRAGDKAWPTIVDLSNEIVELKKQLSLDTTEISIRADKGGWISDDLASFVNGFVLFGLATPRPIVLSEKAVGMCREVLQSDSARDADAVREFCQRLGIPFNPQRAV